VADREIGNGEETAMKSRKAMTVLAVVIMLSLVMMPATAFAGAGDRVKGTPRIVKHVYPGHTFEFRINVKQLANYPYVTGWVYKRDLYNNRVQRINRVSCAKIKAPGPLPDKAFIGGRGSGRWRGYYVMIVVKDNGTPGSVKDKLWIRKTKSRKFFRNWCKNPTTWTSEHRWKLVSGNLRIID
jgi:hypothetical protein